MIELGGALRNNAEAPKRVLASLTWTPEDRDEFYEKLWAARRELNKALVLKSIAPDSDVPAETGNDAYSEMDRIWRDDMPAIDERHAPALRALLDVYASALDDGERERV